MTTPTQLSLDLGPEHTEIPAPVVCADGYTYSINSQLYYWVSKSKHEVHENGMCEASSEPIAKFDSLGQATRIRDILIRNAERSM